MFDFTRYDLHTGERTQIELNEDWRDRNSGYIDLGFLLNKIPESEALSLMATICVRMNISPEDLVDRIAHAVKVRLR